MSNTPRTNIAETAYKDWLAKGLRVNSRPDSPPPDGWAIARQLETELQTALSTARREVYAECVPYADIREAIAHIKDNASAIKQFEGCESEARCRQLCAMYLEEWVISHEMGKKLGALDERAAQKANETKEGGK